MNRDEFIDRCEKDVAFFAKHVLFKRKKELSPKQIELIKALKKDKHVAAIFNRQGGKTETLAVYDVHELCFGKRNDGEAMNIFVYAPILSQTEIIMGRIHQFFNTVPLLMGFVDKLQKYHIRMNNGNTIQAMSASEQSHVRGFSPDVIQIDETQDISDRVYYDDILPSGAATGARIQETGTPKGRNHFYNLSRMRDGTVSMVTQTWEECPFIDKDYVLRRKARMPRDKFNAEFCCQFLTDTSVAFATKMLDKIIVLDVEQELPTMYDFFLGGDLGKQDESVFVILGVHEGKLYQVDMRRLSAFQSYKIVFEEIVSLFDEYNIVLGIIDMSGVGEGIVDLLPNELPVTGEFLTNEMKQDMVDEFMKLGEGGAPDGEFDPKIFLWKDYDLKQQFYEWEAKKLRSGKTRFHHPDGSHDDMVVAALLAAKAYVDENTSGDYGASNYSSNTTARTGQADTSLSFLRHNNPFGSR